MDQKELDRVLENLLFAYRHYVQLPYLEIQQTTFDNHGGSTSTDACVCVVTHNDLGDILDYITDLQQLASDLDAQNTIMVQKIVEYERKRNEHPEE